MRKGLLGVVVGVGMMFAQSASAADMVRYDKSANNIQPELTVAQLQMDGSCQGAHCQPCARQCPPRHCHHHQKHHHHKHHQKHHHHKHHANKACHTGKHHHHHHKHSVKKQRAAHKSIEEKKMSSNRNHPAARKTSANDTYLEEYIDDVGREHR